MIGALGHLRTLSKGSRRVDVRGFHVCLTVGGSRRTFARVRGLTGRCPCSVHCLAVLKSICLGGNGRRRTCRACRGMLGRRPNCTPTLLSVTSCCRGGKRSDLCRMRLSAVLLGSGISDSAGVGVVHRLVLHSRRAGGSDAGVTNLFASVLGRGRRGTSVTVLTTRCLLAGGVSGRTAPILRRILRVSPRGAPTHLRLLDFTVHRRGVSRMVGLYTPTLRCAPSMLRFCCCVKLTCRRGRGASRTLRIFGGKIGRMASGDGGSVISSFCTVVKSLCRVGGVGIRTCTTCSSTLICGRGGVKTLGGCTCCLSMRHGGLSGTRRVDCHAMGTRPAGNACLSACT